jgi:hypothetical protein
VKNVDVRACYCRIVGVVFLHTWVVARTCMSTAKRGIICVSTPRDIAVKLTCVSVCLCVCSTPHGIAGNLCSACLQSYMKSTMLRWLLRTLYINCMYASVRDVHYTSTVCMRQVQDDEVSPA